MASNPLTDPQWAERIVDRVDALATIVRRYTTDPVIKIVRGVVFGLLAMLGFFGVLALLLIAIPRAMHSALDSAVSREAAVWISYFVLSALFVTVGSVAMRRRHSKDPS